MGILTLLISLSLLSSSNSSTVDVTADYDNEEERAASSSAQRQRPPPKKSSSLLPSSIKLNDGNFIPRVGLGVALTGGKTYDSVSFALDEVGYRLFDTASEESYDNEDQVGSAIFDHYLQNKNSNKNDEDEVDDIFVTTKLWDTDHGFYNTIKAFMISYRQLNSRNINGENNLNVEESRRMMKPINLYLIHSPFGGRILETYDAMLYIQRQVPEKLKSIGVSNFGINHLEVIRKNNRPLPTLNQIEMHPLVYKQRKDLIEYCSKHNIQIQAFGSLMHGYSEFVGDNTPSFITDMVHRYNTNGIKYNVYNNNNNDDDGDDDNKLITTAHVLLQWAIQHGFAIIPKSSRSQRIQHNVRYINLNNGDDTTNDNNPQGSSSTPSLSSLDFVLLDEDMKLLDDWGDTVSYQERNIYKRDWNWNPIDEAKVHTGRTYYWKNDFVDVDINKINLHNIDDLDYSDDEYDDDGYFYNQAHHHHHHHDDDVDENEDEVTEYDDDDINDDLPVDQSDSEL